MSDLSSSSSDQSAAPPLAVSVASHAAVGKDHPVFTSLGVQDGVATLKVTGEVDIAVADDLAAAALGALAQDGAQSLRVDLAGVTFLDSSGLGALVRVRNAAHDEGKELLIANPVESVMKVFTITGLDAVLAFETSGEGLAGPVGSADA